MNTGPGPHGWFLLFIKRQGKNKNSINVSEIWVLMPADYKQMSVGSPPGCWAGGGRALTEFYFLLI